MTTQPELLDRILAFPLEQPTADYDFRRRLQGETGWSVAFADAAITEYKKFIYLICVADRRIAPSPVVDEVWHLHIRWTQNYREEFCRQTLGRMILHQPFDEGIAAELGGDFEAAINLYYREFEDTPPPEIWRSSHKPRSTSIVDASIFLVLRKRHIEMAVLGLIAVALLTLAWNLDWEGRKAEGIATAISAMVYLVFRNRRKSKNIDAACSASCTASGCGGHGCGGH